MTVEKKYKEIGLHKAIGDIDQIAINYDAMAELLIDVYKERLVEAREYHMEGLDEASKKWYEKAEQVKSVLTAAGIIIKD